MGRAFGKPILFTREGGSGPAADLQDVLGAPVLFLGISVPSDGWHAPNEKVELDLLLKGVETTAYLWGDLAEHCGHTEPPSARDRRHLTAHRRTEPACTEPPDVPPGELEAPVTTWTDHTADRPIALTAPSGIDRAAHHRLDEAWLAAAWSHPTTRVLRGLRRPGPHRRDPRRRAPNSS